MQGISKELLEDYYRVIDLTDDREVVQGLMNKYSGMGYIPQWFYSDKLIMIKALDEKQLEGNLPPGPDTFSVPGAMGSA